MSERDSPSDFGSPSTTKIRVLIVEDHELLRDGLIELLGNNPRIELCGEAVGEDEAIDLVVTTRPNLVIVDLALTQGDGISLVKRITQFDPVIQVIVCSMHDDRLYAERSFSAGASGYVPKQAPAREMLDAVADVMAGRIYRSPSLSHRSDSVNNSNGSSDPIESLSTREMEVFRSIGRGLMTGEIAELMRVSPRTIDTYRERIKVKLELRTASELSRCAIEWVLLAE